jgi:hypothetical protein
MQIVSANARTCRKIVSIGHIRASYTYLLLISGIVVEIQPSISQVESADMRPNQLEHGFYEKCIEIVFLCDGFH